MTLLVLTFLPAVALLHTAAANAATLTWSTPSPIEGYSSSGVITSVSSPTTTFCVAVDNSGYITTYNGSTWSTPTSIDVNSLDSLSFPTTTFCSTADSIGNYMI